MPAHDAEAVPERGVEGVGVEMPVGAARDRDESGRPGVRAARSANTTSRPTLHASEIEGRIHQVPGIEHIISISMKRWNDPTAAASDLIEVRFNEIIQVKNDPDAMELGYINFTLEGGRQ